MKNNSYLKTEVNKHFKVKVYSCCDKGKTVNSLRGYSGLVDLIGRDLAHKMILNALNDLGDRRIYKLRRGLKITFYSI